LCRRPFGALSFRPPFVSQRDVELVMGMGYLDLLREMRIAEGRIR
jgi:hypothetical protein